MVHQGQHFDFVEDSCIMEFYESVEQGVPKTHNFSVITPHLPGATTHAGSWPTQKVASNHLYLWP
jgi:hypothetical protein